MAEEQIEQDWQALPQRRGDNPWGRRATVAIAVGLVVVPIVLTAVPAEMGRWHQAAAVESALNEDYEAAVKSLDKAVQRSPDSVVYLAQRAAIKIKLKRFSEAIEDCELALKRGPDPSALYQRAAAYQRLGEHRLALDDIETFVDLAASAPPVFVVSEAGFYRISYEDALNTRAYARALANMEIDAALDDINIAFERMGQDDIAHYLDTRGYLYFLAGDYERSEKDMQRAVKLTEERCAEVLEDANSEDNALLARDCRENLAVLYHHRGLVLDALGRKKEAERDLELAVEYGYSPEDGVW